MGQAGPEQREKQTVAQPQAGLARAAVAKGPRYRMANPIRRVRQPMPQAQEEAARGQKILDCHHAMYHLGELDF